MGEPSEEAIFKFVPGGGGPKISKLPSTSHGTKGSQSKPSSASEIPSLSSSKSSASLYIKSITPSPSSSGDDGGVSSSTIVIVCF